MLLSRFTVMRLVGIFIAVRAGKRVKAGAMEGASPVELSAKAVLHRSSNQATADGSQDRCPRNTEFLWNIEVVCTDTITRT